MRQSGSHFEQILQVIWIGEVTCVRKERNGVVADFDVAVSEMVDKDSHNVW